MGSQFPLLLALYFFGYFSYVFLLFLECFFHFCECSLYLSLALKLNENCFRKRLLATFSSDCCKCNALHYTALQMRYTMNTKQNIKQHQAMQFLRHYIQLKYNLRTYKSMQSPNTYIIIVYLYAAYTYIRTSYASQYNQMIALCLDFSANISENKNLMNCINRTIDRSIGWLIDRSVYLLPHLLPDRHVHLQFLLTFYAKC